MCGLDRGGGDFIDEHSFCIFFSLQQNTTGFISPGSWSVVQGEHAQLRWKPFSMVAARRRSLMISSDEYSGNFR